MSKPPGPIVLGIIKLLEELGPMTRAELAAAMNRPKADVSAVVSRMSRRTKTGPKRIYVIRYVHTDDTSSHAYPRAVYALGNKENERRPKPQPSYVITKRHRDNKKMQVNSVWQFAQPRRVRDAERKSRAGIP